MILSETSKSAVFMLNLTYFGIF